jgi:fructokinase
MAEIFSGFRAEALSMKKPIVMVGLGELLWDFLPSKRALGGAPTNFAYMTNVLGDRGVVASRVGKDVLGKDACDVMDSLGLTTDYVQHDGEHETGSAGVLLDPSGLPTFTIKESVAWDFLEWTSAWDELSRRADVVCYGSLAQRSPISANTIDRFLSNTQEGTLKIFDINLRQSFYTKGVLHKLFLQADIVKLTDEEMWRVGSMFLSDGRHDEERLAKWLQREFDLQLVCVTRGGQGSLLISKSKVVEHPGLKVKVMDTVGAGDAFTACLAHEFIRGRSLTDISESANRFAAWVVTQVGAMPKIKSKDLRQVLAGPDRLLKQKQV